MDAICELANELPAFPEKIDLKGEAADRRANVWVRICHPSAGGLGGLNRLYLERVAPVEDLLCKCRDLRCSTKIVEVELEGWWHVVGRTLEVVDIDRARNGEIGRQDAGLNCSERLLHPQAKSGPSSAVVASSLVADTVMCIRVADQIVTSPILIGCADAICILDCGAMR